MLPLCTINQNFLLKRIEVFYFYRNRFLLQLLGLFLNTAPNLPPIKVFLTFFSSQPRLAVFFIRRLFKGKSKDGLKEAEIKPYALKGLTDTHSLIPLKALQMKNRFYVFLRFMSMTLLSRAAYSPVLYFFLTISFDNWVFWQFSNWVR